MYSPCCCCSEALPSTHSLLQKPVAMPAANAAPREVVSKCSGLRTGICGSRAVPCRRSHIAETASSDQDCALCCMLHTKPTLCTKNITSTLPDVPGSSMIVCGRECPAEVL